MTQLPDRVLFIERDWLSCNQVLLFDDGQATVVDTGYHKHRDITSQLIAHSLTHHQPGKSARLARIINTHLHADHCGANAVLAQEHDTQIIVPAACEAAVQSWDVDQLMFKALRQQCDRFQADATFSPGDTFVAGELTWEVHGAPGHDPTSLIFFAPEPCILISADAFWEQGFGLIFPEIFDESGFAEQESVLNLIESLKPKIVLPGHGRIFTDVDRAMTVSRSRLAALRAEPARNNRNALKALVTFTMLDVERLNLEELMTLVDGGEVLTAAAGALGFSLFDGVKWATEQLVRQQVLRQDGDYLVSH